MAVVLIANKLKAKDIRVACEDYRDYIKITLDIETGLMAIGGEWHSDGEKILLENGSKQENIWGGGIDIKSKQIDYNALINLRPGQGNDSMEILDKKIRQRFVKIVKEKFNLL